jgi:hypothetical protein
MRKLHYIALSLTGLAMAAGTALGAAPPAGAATTAPMTFPDQLSQGIIVNANSGKCLQPSVDNINGNGDLVVQSTCNGSPAQSWEVRPIGTRNYTDWLAPFNLPSYRIVNVGSGLCLDDRDGVASDGAAVQQWACNNTSTTMVWTNIGDYDQLGRFAIVNLRASNKRSPNLISLEVASGSTADNVPVQLVFHYLGNTPPAEDEWVFQPGT